MDEIENILARAKEFTIKHKGPDSPLSVKKEVICGTELEVFEKIPKNLKELYQLGLEAADKVFLVYAQERYTFKETYDIAAKLSKVLVLEYRIQKRDRVAICSRNYPEWCFAYMAVTMLGAIVVPMNSWWKGCEMEYGLKDSGSRVLFADQERINRILPFLDNLDLNVIGIKPDKPLPNNILGFDQLIQRVNNDDIPQVVVAPDEDATIMYTSGSTGHPKGVLSSHRSILNALYTWKFSIDIAEQLNPDLVDENPEFDSAILANVPLFHVTGSHAQFLVSFVFHRKFVMMYKWDPEKALELIESERITILHGVPTMTWEVMHSADFDKRDLRSLKAIQGGGASRPPEHVTMMVDKFPNTIPALGYGLTETNAIGATISGEFYKAKPTSTGRVTAPVTSIKIIDKNGNELEANQEGEICFKGPTIMKGYWNNPEETKKVLKESWFHTGDIGKVDEYGFLYIVDRAKDIVIRGGENIGCAEVEYAIAEHPSVYECSVFGVPDNRLGEVVAASVMLKKDSELGQEELQQFLEQKIAKFKIPSYIWFQYKQLPRIASGKIAKKQIRDEAIIQLNEQLAKYIS